VTVNFISTVFYRDRPIPIIDSHLLDPQPSTFRRLYSAAKLSFRGGGGAGHQSAAPDERSASICRRTAATSTELIGCKLRAACASIHARTSSGIAQSIILTSGDRRFRLMGRI